MESQPAGKSGRYKAKNKKAPAKTKIPKKKKSDGPSCSLFLSELTKKLASKRKKEEEDTESGKSIVHSIIDTISNALPVTLSKKVIEKKDSPVKMEELQTFAPELLPSDTVQIPVLQSTSVDSSAMSKVASVDYSGALSPNVKMPRMPIVLSDVMKPPIRRMPVETQETAVNTGGDHDVAGEITKHVNTLRKISLIAEEFNQKTAKNLKEIVDSVQEDLIKKLEEIQAEQRAKQEEVMQVDDLAEQIA